MNNKRLFLSLSDSDLERLDKRRAEFGMNRSEYIRYILSSQRKAIPYSISQKELVKEISQVNLYLKTICLIPMTPATSFQMRSGVGTAPERALAFNLMKECKILLITKSVKK